MTLTDDQPRSAAGQPVSVPMADARWGRWKLVAFRAVAVAIGLAAWFGTQALLGSRGYHGQIEDGLLAALGGLNAFLHAHPWARDALLISSSAVIDILGVFLLARSIFGRTIRPFLGLLMLFGLRQIFQTLCVLPAPEGMIWEHPGFPSLLVTYGVSNDLFFSGHTALAVFGAVELVRWGGKRWIWAGVAIAGFEATAVLALRAHWTMDVYAGAVTALLVACMVERPARWVDSLLAKTA